MVDPVIAGLAARKYQLEQQQLDSSGNLQRAQANLTNVNAGLAPAEAAARNLALRGQAASSFASGHLQDVNAQLAPQIAQGALGLQAAQVQEAGARGNLINQQTSLLPQNTGMDWLRTLHGLNPQIDPLSGPQLYNKGTSNVDGGAGASGGSAKSSPGGKGEKNYKKGTPKVPGKGSPNVDSVPSMLAPGEAVLNAGAAEHLGRNVIDLLNAIGESKMGGSSGTGPGASMAEAQNTGGMPGYATGTDNVTAGGINIRPGTSGTWDPSQPAAQVPGANQPRFDVRRATNTPGVVRKPPSFAKGTSRVEESSGSRTPQKSAKPKAGPARSAAEPSLSPQMLRAVLAMGGGGFPAPNSAPPLPMPLAR